MVRFGIVMTTALVLLVAVAAPLAQAQAPSDGAGAPKPSKVTTTRERLGEMLAKWRHNRPKLKACRTDGSLSRSVWANRDGPLGHYVCVELWLCRIRFLSLI
jgi:hypothetical protein